MAPLDSQEKGWVLDMDGIYKSKAPIVITVPFILKEVSEIIDDYTQDTNRTEKLMILVDITEQTDCSDEVLSMINHSIRNQLKSRLAYFGKNPEFKKTEDLFYLTHSRASNFKTFETKQEAISWLKSLD